MTIWTRISDYVVNAAGTAISGVVEQLRTLVEGDPQTRHRVAFSIAMIALSAKMAKADGVVTEDEVSAFQDIFEIPDDEAKRVSMLYNLAKQDTAGFESYATQIADLCRTAEADDDTTLLYDVLDGLFHIAKADGIIHDSERIFLRRIGEIFGLSEQQFDSVLARHVDGGDSDPWRILGLAPDVDFDTARTRYHALVRENHPDRLMARGVPEEFIRIANDRIAAINTAWERVEGNFRR